jgi:polyisoprenoid-binding protein YceI
MKSFIIRKIQSAARTASTVSLAIIVIAFTTRACFASSTFSLDSGTSSALFFQGSRANPDSANTGVARVTGVVNIDPNNLDNSVVDLNIFPADEEWGHALTPEGTLPSNYVPDATDQTLLRFQSRRFVKLGNGELEVVGDLTLTRVERSVTINSIEAYAGPVYGDPVIHNETREIAFRFGNLSEALLSGSSNAISPEEKAKVDLSGAVRVAYEDFPDLLNAIQDTNWPTVVENEKCQMPSTIGDDYHGTSCTGTVIAATRRDNCHMPASVGEDYSGPVCTPPAGTQTTIVLDLKLLNTASR